jgi:multiple sugar transport system ATP-binding protein
VEYLKLENLTKVFQGKIVAVDQMTLGINKGEFLVLLGPSGCGKTTTMRMIAGLEEVTHGDILLEEHSIKDLPPKDRNVSMIFQSYAVWPHMTVRQNIEYPLKLKKLPKSERQERIKEAAEMANITEYLERYPANLSGGQRQRVAVARAMAVKPKLFLMDEPLSNLDAKLRVSMRTELKKAHEQLGSTTIFVTHDQSEAMSLADRIVVMRMGAIEQIGTPNEIYHDCETMFVANFIGSPPTNFLDVEAEITEDEVKLKHKLFTHTVQQPLADKLRENRKTKIVLGIRPENFVVVSDETDPSILFTRKILFVEPQGSHTIIVVEVDGKQLKLVTSDVMSYTVGQEIKIAMNDKYMLFDAETEKRIK